MACTELRNHQSWSLALLGSLSDLWCHYVVKSSKLMDNVSCSEVATHAFLCFSTTLIFRAEHWLQHDHMSTSWPCEKVLLKLFFSVILGMKLREFRRSLGMWEYLLWFEQACFHKRGAFFLCLTWKGEVFTYILISQNTPKHTVWTHRSRWQNMIWPWTLKRVMCPCIVKKHIEM